MHNLPLFKVLHTSNKGVKVKTVTFSLTLSLPLPLSKSTACICGGEKKSKKSTDFRSALQCQISTQMLRKAEPCQKHLLTVKLCPSHLWSLFTFEMFGLFKLSLKHFRAFTLHLTCYKRFLKKSVSPPLE